MGYAPIHGNVFRVADANISNKKIALFVLKHVNKIRKYVGKRRLKCFRVGVRFFSFQYNFISIFAVHYFR